MNVYECICHYRFGGRYGSFKTTASIQTDAIEMRVRALNHLKLANNPKNQKLLEITELEYLNSIGL